MNRVLTVVLAAVSVWAAGCGNDGDAGHQADELVIISPHHKAIKSEFETAFRRQYSQDTGRDVAIVWRDIGGGGSAILNYLRNIYSRSETCGVDLLWGGGENIHQRLEHESLLEAVQMPDDVLAQIPQSFGGMNLYSAAHRWYGTVLSGFGFLYNKPLLDKLGLSEPKQWSDVASPAFFDRVMLADPTESASMAAAFEMIVQSADSWPAGWGRLLMLLGNAKGFAASSGTAADAPIVGQAVAAACIDFFGTSRVAKYPDTLVYVTPAGQSGFTPDPIAMLKNPPNRAVAQAFMNFVLSAKAQALWALPVGAPDGPQGVALNRLPIRQDVYKTYAGQFPVWIADPYDGGADFVIDGSMRKVRYDVLMYLVKAAAIDNATLLKKAKHAVDAHPERQEAFIALPESIDSVEDIIEAHGLMESDQARGELVSQWSRYYRSLYERIIAEP